ncbi:X-box-binding protein 1-like [Tachypleus tridentatus]|uniref:X-box-binding protein 1-like n=1 Tax=Tachypleus tridentatus TaxID=6853 RepID=UPI003FD54D2B
MAIVITNATNQIGPEVLKKCSSEVTNFPDSTLSSLNLCSSITTLPRSGMSILKSEKDFKSDVLNQNSEGKSKSQSAMCARKRERLDHLSFEEKIMRRKLKNRVAAQSARDRKKARLDELEITVKVLEKEKLLLLSENKTLKRKLMLLENENSDLRSRLGLKEIKEEQEDMMKNCINREKDFSRSFKQASLINGPLQKEQDLPVVLLMMQYIFLPVMMSLMTSLTCFSSTVKSYSSILKNQNILFHPALTVCGMEKVKISVIKWWGPQQKSWNPSKN